MVEREVGKAGKKYQHLVRPIAAVKQRAEVSLKSVQNALPDRFQINF